MRIHTNKIGYTQTFRNLLKAEQKAGRIAPSVRIATIQPHRSQSHLMAFELVLESPTKEIGDGRKQGQSGYVHEGNYGATYDEWGWMLAAIFRADDEASTRDYADREVFDHATGLTFNPDALLRILKDTEENWGEASDPYPYLRSASARRRAGRNGQGRIYFDAPRNQLYGVIESPRTAADVRKFAHLAPTATGIEVSA